MSPRQRLNQAQGEASSAAEGANSEALLEPLLCVDSSASTSGRELMPDVLSELGIASTLARLGNELRAPHAISVSLEQQLESPMATITDHTRQTMASYLTMGGASAICGVMHQRLAARRTRIADECRRPFAHTASERGQTSTDEQLFLVTAR